MRDAIWLRMNARGVIGMTKRRPLLAAGEVSAQIEVIVPNSVFKTPAISATLEVPESAVLQPTIVVEVVDPAPGVLPEQEAQE